MKNIGLTCKLLQQFSRSGTIIKTMQKISDKFKVKQTVADKQKLQSFLTEQTRDGSIKETIDVTAKYDAEFKSFIKDYQAKHKQYPHILDLSHYSRENSTLSKSNQLRQEEIDMIEEFRNRKIKKINEPIDLIDYSKDPEINEADEEVGEEDFSLHQDPYIQEDRNHGYKAKEMRMGLNDDFMIVLLDRDVTTQVTTLNRVNHFRYLIFMGNGNGLVGYGKGKGSDFEEALDNAILHCKRNLIAVPLDIFHTVPEPLEGHFNGFQIKIHPSRTFNPWGAPVIASMLLLTGLRHCRFKTISKKVNPYALVMAYFRMITKNRTPKDICEQTGKKIYRENWGAPYFLNHVSQNFL
ncbi:hypothetical protein ABPG72_002190 [Tetrahymena utriculariae]